MFSGMRPRLEHVLVFANPGSKVPSREAGDMQIPAGLTWMQDVPAAAAWLDALAAIGRKDEARELFERILARRNPLGLLSEDLAFDGGEAWGNFPQTYSHVGLIIAAMRLSRSWQEAS